jgi:hypothetical protein
MALARHDRNTSAQQGEAAVALLGCGADIDAGSNRMARHNDSDFSKRRAPICSPE